MLQGVIDRSLNILTLMVWKLGLLPPFALSRVLTKGPPSLEAGATSSIRRTWRKVKHMLSSSNALPREPKNRLCDSTLGLK